MSRSRHDDPFSRENPGKKLDKKEVNRHDRKEKKDLLKQITTLADLDLLDTEILFE